MEVVVEQVLVEVLGEGRGFGDERAGEGRAPALLEIVSWLPAGDGELARDAVLQLAGVAGPGIAF